MKHSVDTMQTFTRPVQPEGRPVKWSRMLYIVLGVVLAGLIAMTVMVVLTYIQVKKVEDNNMQVDNDESSLSLSEKWSLERMVEAQREDIDEKDIRLKDVAVNIRYHLPQAGTIEERVVVTADEEDISTPEVRVIYDYRHGHVVTHFRTSPNESDKDVCFVRKFTPTNEGTELLKNTVINEKEDTYLSHEVTEELFEATGDVFDKTGLSERSATMCENSEVYVVTKSATMEKWKGGSPVRRKRKGGCAGFKFCGPFCLTVQVDKAVQTCTKNWWTKKCKYVVRSFPKSECFNACYCFIQIG